MATTADCNDSTIVAGAYTGAIQFSGEDIKYLGDTDDGGFEIEIDYSFEDITTDQHGDMVIGALNRGGNCYVNATFKEFNRDGVQRLLHSVSNFEGQVGAIGCDVRQLAFSLRLTELVDFANQPLEYVFSYCQLDPNVPIRFALSSRLRVLPFRFRIFPDLTNPAAPVWYTRNPTNP